MIIFQVCPKCNGQGITSNPPYFPGTVYEELKDSSASYYICNLCRGDRVIATLNGKFLPYDQYIKEIP